MATLPLLLVFDKAHSDTSDGRFNHTGVHQGKTRAANACWDVELLELNISLTVRIA